MADEREGEEVVSEGPRLPSSGELFSEFVPKYFAALDREKKPGVRRAVQRGQQRLTITVRRVKRKELESDNDLPEMVKRESKAIKLVFRTVRRLRAVAGADGTVSAEGIFAEFTKGEITVLRTVFRALKRLRAMGDVRRDPATGYHLGLEQPGLSFSECHSQSAVQRARKD